MVSWDEQVRILQRKVDELADKNQPVELELSFLRKIAILMYKYDKGRMNRDKLSAISLAKHWHKHYGKPK